MPTTSIIFGTILATAGVIAYIATGASSPTALIPSGFGAVLLACGIAGVTFPKARMHVMHVAALAGLLGTLGGLGMGLPATPALLAGTAERPLAVIMQLVLGSFSLVFLVLCVRSFIAARRARKAE